MVKSEKNEAATIDLGQVVPTPIPNDDIDLILEGETPVGTKNALNTNGLKYFFNNMPKPSYPVGIANGGTGATSAEDARENLGLAGAETKTLIWVNASPASGFEGQTLSLDLNDYTYIEILFRDERDEVPLYFIEKFKIDAFSPGACSYVFVANGYLNGIDRSVGPSNTAVNFGHGILSSHGGFAQNAALMKPYKI